MLLDTVLYQLTEKDLKGNLVNYFGKTHTNTGLDLSSVIYLPRTSTPYNDFIDRVLVVQGFDASALAGAGQLCTDLKVEIMSDAGVIEVGRLWHFDPNTQFYHPELHLIDFLLPWPLCFKVSAAFNANAVNNNLTASLSGWLIPKGSVRI